MSIQNEINRINENISSVYNVAKTKGANIPSVQNSANLVSTIQSIQTGLETIIVSKDVNFYDPYGNLIVGWTLEQARTASSLPNAPNLDRLIFQEWNWSLEDINALNGPADIGAIYVTASGASEFDLTLTEVTGLTVNFRFYNITAGDTITVDWGDGKTDNAATTVVGMKNFVHTYVEYGEYMVSVNSNGTYYPYGASSTPFNMFNTNPSYICTEVRFGIKCTSIGAYSFQHVYNLKNVILPSNVTSMGLYAFANCYGLTKIVIPSKLIPSRYMFQACYSLYYAIIPNNVTIIESYLFRNCYNLKRVVIPPTVTSMGDYVFQDCFIATEYIILPQNPPTLSNNSLFTNINGICKMWVPRGSLQAYKSATNWTTYSKYMFEIPV